jgi:hypothetical protein
MTIIRRSLLFAFLCLPTTSALVGQTVLTGTVREDSTGRPLGGVEVLVTGSNLRTVTNAAGRYSLDGLPKGRRIVLFRSLGYRPTKEWVLLGDMDTVWANASMVPQTVQLDPITVTGEPRQPRGIGREAFEERRRLGFGKFIDSTDLRRSEHLRVTDLLNRTQGVEVWTPPPPDHWMRIAVSRRREGVCPLQIVLDGVVLYRTIAPSAKLDPETLVDMKGFFDIAGLEAIEIYRGASEVPVEYGGAGAGCGAILFWTRRS